MKNKAKKPEGGYTLKAFKTANRLVLDANGGLYLAYIFVSLVYVANTFLLLWSSEYTVSGVYELMLGRLEFESLAAGLALIAAAQILFMSLSAVKRLMYGRLELDLTRRFELVLNGKLSRIRWDCFESNEINLKIHEVKANSLAKLKSFVEATVGYITKVPMLLIYGYFLFQINMWFVLIYFALLIVCNVMGGRMLARLSDLWGEIQPYSQKQSYFFGMCSGRVSHQEFVLNRLYGRISKGWEEAYDGEYKKRLKIFTTYELILQSGRIVNNIPYIAMLIFVCYEIAIGKLGIGYLTLANRLLNFVLDTVLGTFRQLSQNRVDSRFVRSFDELLELEEVESERGSGDFERLSLENIGYVYPQSERRALHGLSLEIRRGEKLALVGVNGSGKTTCMNLLLGLTDRYDGSITDSGTPFKPDGSVACILQDFMQYQLTIKENIALGYIKKQFSDEEVKELLDRVGLLCEVEKLEKGIHTPLGQLDNGIELSKGQWQRLAIARLLANPEAKLWILDEPTAYLDPISEIEIYELIYRLASDRTVLFISHRLGFARRADRVAVFEDGHIGLVGTHAELLALGGVYADMYKSQEQWYT